MSNMELHLARLSGPAAEDNDRDNQSSSEPSQHASPGRRSLDDEEDDDDEDGSESPSMHTTRSGSADVHVFRNRVDMLDRYYGPSSLFTLCNNFKLKALTSDNAVEVGTPLHDMLQSLCEIAGTTEPFPSYSDQSLVHLLPKQQAVTAISHFFHLVDCTTDVFVQSSLLANVERVYSQPLKPVDEAWAICFKTIILLVLGKEISAQAMNALVGDFARSFLPSRAALINSRLLTAPRLINVQTLILLVTSWALNRSCDGC